MSHAKYEVSKNVRLVIGRKNGGSIVVFLSISIGVDDVMDLV